jgi:LAO/AO transport system kinase
LIRAGDRRALARAITLVESGRPDHRAQALAFWTPARRRPRGPAHRPVRHAGVGKSTFIEAFG